MSFLNDIVDYQKFLGKAVLRKWKDDPERALLGINTPFESKMWGGVTGKDYEPTVDMFGGDTKQQQDAAAASGIRTGPGESMHDIARAVTSFYAGGYGAGKAKGLMSPGMQSSQWSNFPTGGMGGGGGSGQQSSYDPSLNSQQFASTDPNVLAQQEAERQQALIASVLGR